jgi:hypothetical protein
MLVTLIKLKLATHLLPHRTSSPINTRHATSNGVGKKATSVFAPDKSQFTHYTRKCQIADIKLQIRVEQTAVQSVNTIPYEMVPCHRKLRLLDGTVGVFCPAGQPQIFRTPPAECSHARRLHLAFIIAFSLPLASARNEYG